MGMIFRSCALLLVLGMFSHGLLWAQTATSTPTFIERMNKQGRGGSAVVVAPTDGVVTTAESDEDDSTAEGAKSGDKKKKKELPQTGVLSQTTRGGTQGLAVGMPWGKDYSMTGAQGVAPITASASKKTEREWLVKVFNNSKDDTYSANLKLEQVSPGGGVVKSDSFSVHLKPGASDERPVSAALNATNARVSLVGWKKYSAKSKSSSSAASGMAAGADAMAAKSKSPPKGGGR